MPRADPTRSAYCASRHLLRNLDDAAELRRNPLVRSLFPSPARGDAVGEAAARVRGLVHASLARCRERSGARTHGTLGRMQAALLRCEIDRQPLSVVARELGLSDRQVRRERRAAHDAFLDAFRRAQDGAVPAAVQDVGRLRIGRACDLHDFGQSALALAACEAMAANAAPAHRIEALCLAAEIERDLGRFGDASARIARASAMLADGRRELGGTARALAEEHVDFARWSMQRALGLGPAFAMAAPAIVAHPAAADPGDEPRLALLVDALAAHADQRWEVGDGTGARAALDRAWQLVPGMRAERVKERLAVMIADARVIALRAGDDHAHYLAAERLAARAGRLASLIVARAERIGTEIQRGLDAGGNGSGEALYARAVGTLDISERAMPHAVGELALVLMQIEPALRRRIAAADVALRIFPAQGGRGLIARCTRARLDVALGAYDSARTRAYAVRNDAEAAGNARAHGNAERILAEIAFAQRRRRDAARHLDVALPILERYGTRTAHDAALLLAHRIDATRPRTFLSANFARTASR